MSVEPIADKRLAEVRELLALGPGHIVPSRATILSIIARLDKAEAGWQDITTAPKDGSRVLVYAQLNPPEKWCEEVRDLEPIICGASYHPDAGFCVCEVREVTHWMPLPPPPSKGP